MVQKNNKSFKCFLHTLLLILLITIGCEKKLEDTITITLAVGRDVTGAQQQLIEKFESQFPSIKVRLIEMPESASSQHDSYVTYLSAKDTSTDIYSIDVIWVSEFASAGWILSLDEFFSPKESKKFLKGPIDACTHKGKTYSIPWFTDAGLFYYRKDILDKEKLPPPETWKELVDQCQNLGKKYDIYGFVFQGKQYEGLVCNFLEYLWSNDGRVIDEHGKIVIDNKNSIDALEFMVNLVHKHKTTPAGITTYKEEESRQLFTEGNAVFHRNWPYVWTIAQNTNKSKIANKVGITSLPYNTGNKGISCLGGWNLAISRFSKYPKESWQFIKFMTKFESQKYYAIKGGRLPTLKSVYKDKEVLSFAPYYKDLFEVFVTARARPVTPYYSQISDILQVELHQALTLKKTSKDALTYAKKKIEHLLEQKK